LRSQPAQSEFHSSRHGQIAGDVAPHGSLTNVQLSSGAALRQPSIVKKSLQAFEEAAGALLGRNVRDTAVMELIAAVVELVKAVTGDVVPEELPSCKETRQ
jgi:hypothetical protein